jgi:hypothetical protein
MRLAMIAGIAACSGGSAMVDVDAAAPEAAVPDAPTVIDDDGDGLDDRREQQLAIEYVPFISIDPSDGCPLSGLVARVRVHPADATKILIVYSHLFQRDCGLGGHVGDNEAFGIAIDPTVPPPAGILAIRTASHQNTPCERVSECSHPCSSGPLHTSAASHSPADIRHSVSNGVNLQFAQQAPLSQSSSPLI